MKKVVLILFVFFVSLKSFSQTEFETYKNGLIYSDVTMGKLQRIVDSGYANKKWSLS